MMILKRKVQAMMPIMKCMVLLTIWASRFRLSSALPPSTTRILSIGDELTEGTVPGGYRKQLYSDLLEKGYNVEMLGRKKTNPFGNKGKNHEGWPDRMIEDFSDEKYLDNLVDKVKQPDVIILHVGRVDFAANEEIVTAVYRYGDLLSALAERFPFSNIIATNLMHGVDDSVNHDIDLLFNLYVEDRVSEVASARLRFYDLSSNVDSSMFIDDMLPSQDGYNKMGSSLAQAVESVIGPDGDSFAPTISSIEIDQDKEIYMVMSKPVADESADPAHFDIDHSVRVKGCVLSSDKRTVILRTSSFKHLEGKSLKITVMEGVIDRTVAGRSIASSTEASVVVPMMSDTTEPMTLLPTSPPKWSKEVAKSTTRILALGDMLTVGGDFPGGYRTKLYSDLLNLGYKVDMLGSKSTNPDPSIDTDHEGWEGKTTEFFLALINTILDQADDPDVILLHVGMMDFIFDTDIVEAVYRFQDLMMKIADLRPHTNIIATNLLKHEVPSIDDDIVALFNNYAKDRVQLLVDRGYDRISFIDMRSAVSPYYVQGTSPVGMSDSAGYHAMADAWVKGIQNIMGPNGDFHPPSISKVYTTDYKALHIVFTKPIADTDDASIFDIDDVKIKKIRLVGDKRQILLRTSDLKSMIGATLTIKIGKGITDRTAAERPLPPTTIRYVVEDIVPTSAPSPAPLQVEQKTFEPTSPRSKGKAKGKGSGNGKGKQKSGKGTKSKKGKGTSLPGHTNSPTVQHTVAPVRTSKGNGSKKGKGKKKSKKRGKI